MRVNCQLEREKEDSEGQGGQGREEDRVYYLYKLTADGEYWDILGVIVWKYRVQPPFVLVL